MEAGMEKERKARKGEVAVGSELPAELWREIGKRLKSRIDVSCFRSVCKLWRSSLPYPKRFPLRVPPPPGAWEGDWWCPKPSYIVTEIETYAVDQVNRHVSFEGKEETGKFRPCSCPPWGLRFDFYDHQISSLSFVAKSYRLRLSSDPRDPDVRRKVRKIVLISANANGGVDANYASLCDLSLVALLKGGHLALLRLGGNSDWDTNFCGRRWVTIATYKGELCAIDCFGRAFLMDYHSLRMTELPPTFRIEREQILVGKVML